MRLRSFAEVLCRRLVRDVGRDQFVGDVHERLLHLGAVGCIVVVGRVGGAGLEELLGARTDLGTDGVNFNAFGLHARAK